MGDLRPWQNELSARAPDFVGRTFHLPVCRGEYPWCALDIASREDIKRRGQSAAFEIHNPASLYQRR